jgi:hypothetical protein
MGFILLSHAIPPKIQMKALELFENYTSGYFMIAAVKGQTFFIYTRFLLTCCILLLNKKFI